MGSSITDVVQMLQIPTVKKAKRLLKEKDEKLKDDWVVVDKVICMRILINSFRGLITN